ncbi:MAG: glutamyl-tRNA reductase, partial [Desulfobacterales bacterium]|nr:glutamyl-tRNA reductase [Desulfobacterales bacterium]
MITIVNIGMNHQTAPVELRELVALGRDDIDEVVNAIRGVKDIKEFVVLSTCNRVEILFTTDREKQAKESVIEFLCCLGGTTRGELEPALYIHENQDAIRHIFRVGASL